MNCIICNESFPDLPPETQTYFHCFMKYGPPPKVGDMAMIVAGGIDDDRHHRFINGDIVTIIEITSEDYCDEDGDEENCVRVDSDKPIPPDSSWVKRQSLFRKHFRTLRGDEAP